MRNVVLVLLYANMIWWANCDSVKLINKLIYLCENVSVFHPTSSVSNPNHILYDCGEFQESCSFLLLLFQSKGRGREKTPDLLSSSLWSNSGEGHSRCLRQRLHMSAPVRMQHCFYSTQNMQKQDHRIIRLLLLNMIKHIFKLHHSGTFQSLIFSKKNVSVLLKKNFFKRSPCLISIHSLQVYPTKKSGQNSEETYYYMGQWWLSG